MRRYGRRLWHTRTTLTSSSQSFVGSSSLNVAHQADGADRVATLTKAAPIRLRLLSVVDQTKRMKPRLFMLIPMRLSSSASSADQSWPDELSAKCQAQWTISVTRPEGRPINSECLAKRQGSPMLQGVPLYFYPPRCNLAPADLHGCSFLPSFISHVVQLRHLF